LLSVLLLPRSGAAPPISFCCILIWPVSIASIGGDVGGCGGFTPMDGSSVNASVRGRAILIGSTLWGTICWR
jgi:hypothetical protein